MKIPFKILSVNVNVLYLHFIVELAMIMDRLYGGVCYAGIDTDPELKYPKVMKRIKLLIFFWSIRLK